MPRGSRVDPLNKRADALAAGLLTFDTGLPCKNGHPGQRYTRCLTCVECNKDKFQQLSAENKAKRLALTEEWRNKNRERVNLYAAEYRKANPEKVKQTLRAYRQKNKDKHCHRQQKRHSTKLNACPSWLSPQQLNQIQAIYTHAKYLSTVSGIKMAVDHMVPLQGKTVCGLHVPWNLQILDAQTNSRKHAALTEAAYRPAGDGIMLSGSALPWNWRNHEHHLEN